MLSANLQTTDHSSVTNAATPGALGLISIKAEDLDDNRRMFSFIFGHSTDSMVITISLEQIFPRLITKYYEQALASMSMNDKHPKVIMSRSSRAPKLSIGGYSRILSIRKVEQSPPSH